MPRALLPIALAAAATLAGAPGLAAPAPAPAPATQDASAVQETTAAQEAPGAEDATAVAAEPPREDGSRTLLEALRRDLERARALRERLVERQTALAEEARTERAELEAELARASEMAAEVQIYAPGAQQVDALYGQVVERLQRARTRLEEALDRRNAPLDLPRAEGEIEVGGLDVPAVADLVDELRALREENADLRAVLERRMRDRRWERVDALGSLVVRLNDVRIAAIDKLSPALRSRTLGLFSREGVEQLLREVRQVRLAVRLETARKLRALSEAPRAFSDVYVVGGVAWAAAKFLLLLAVYGFLRRRLRPWETQVRRWLRATSWPSTVRRRAEGAVDAVRPIVPGLLLLLLIWSLRRALGAYGEREEIRVLYRLAMLFGVYRLAIDVIYAGTLGLARRYRLAVEERTGKILRSVRTMMRVLFGIMGFLLLSEEVLGRGYLYRLVYQFSWLFLLVAAFLIIARWHRVIADTFQKVAGQSRLAALVERTRERRLGVFVAAGAFAVLAARALGHLARDFALGFVQIRRALAFLSRRRLERHAERTGYADGDVDALPPALVEACSEAPLEDDTLAIDRFPGRDAFSAMLSRWNETDEGASYLLSGEKGLGKTSWLATLPAGDFPVVRICPLNRVLSPPALLRLLARELEVEVEGEEVEPHALRRKLLDGPKRIVCFDLAQNLFLSRVGGYAAFEAFVSLIEATCQQVFWVCAMSRHACDHLFGVRPDLQVFRHHQALPPWSEEEIRALIRRRNDAAGIAPVYDDLVVDAYDRAGRREGALRTEEAYARLLWDYADGIPRVALHYWLRSLSVDGGGAPRVRLFRAPSSEELDSLGERARFLLAAIVVHENLTVYESSLVTRYPQAICRIQLDRMWDRDILRRERGRYRVTTHWHRAVIRALRRNNLLPA